MQKEEEFAERVVSSILRSEKLPPLTPFHSKLSEFMEQGCSVPPLKSIPDPAARADTFYRQFAPQLTPLINSVLGNTALLKKSDRTSDAFRNIGNNLYKQKKLTIALRCYTLACAFAPPASKSLALGYSNRSACLTEQGKAREALDDIARFESLVSRNLIDDDQLTRVSATVRQRKERCMALIEQQRKHHDNELPQHYVNLHTPNPQIPSAEAFIGIVSNQQSGRHVRNIGHQPIEPGTLLILERPFSKILLDTYRLDQPHAHCAICLKDLTGGGVPCPQCVFHMCCSVECTEQLDTTECLVAHLLHELNMDRTVHLALATLLKLPSADLPAIVKQESSTPYPGFLDNQYSSTSYHPVFKLIYHESLITEREHFKYMTYATTIALILDSTNYFNSDAEKLTFIRLIHLHQMSFPCNAHSLYKLDLQCSSMQPSPEDIRSAAYEEIGAGAFALLSMINHSCDPNVTRVTLPNGTTAVVAISWIPPGAEVLDNYGMHYAVHDKALRESTLSGLYGFKCSCRACVGSWPDIAQVNELQHSVRICPDCRTTKDRVVELSGGCCEQCGYEGNQQLHEYESLCEAAMDNLVSWNAPLALTQSVQSLRYFDSQFDKPFKLINMSQEVMKQALFSLATHLFH